MRSAEYCFAMSCDGLSIPNDLTMMYRLQANEEIEDVRNIFCCIELLSKAFVKMKLYKL